MNSTTTSSPAFIHVPVPASLYETVIHTISDALRSGGIPPTALTADSNDDVPTGDIADGEAVKGWTADEITALRREANAATAAIFNLAAESPGRLIPFEDVVERTGYGYNSARSGLGGLTRSLGKRGKTWPFQAVWGPTIGKDAQMYYEVPLKLLEAWKQAPPGKWEERGPEGDA